MDIQRIDGIIKYYEITKEALDQTLKKAEEMNNTRAKKASEVALTIFTDTIELIKIAKSQIELKNNLDGDISSE